jgi:hypothetical protein
LAWTEPFENRLWLGEFFPALQEFISTWLEEVGGTLGLSAVLSSLTRVVAPTVSGFLLGRVGAPAPGALGALLMAWLVYYTWKKVLFVPNLACPALRLAE